MKSLLALLLLTSVPAFSQDATLETIQVQGNKENKTYSESTESISIVPGKELDSPVQADSVQVLSSLPNVSVNRNDDTFSIRGVNNTGVTGFQKDNVSSILVDDVFQTDLAIKAGSFDLWDINHIEVYRGPQSTSQGVNSLAGSILVFHNKASEQTEGAVKLGYGSYNKLEAGLLTNNAWLEGKLLSRLTYNREQTDGFIKNTVTDNSKWSKKQKDHLGLDLVYKIDENDFIRLNSKLMQTDNGGIYVQGPNPFDYQVHEDVDFISKTKNQQTSLRYFSKLNESWSNEIIGAFSQSDNDETSDGDGMSQSTAGTRYESHNDRFYSLENLAKYQSENVKNVIGFHAHDFYLYDDTRYNLLFPTGGPVIPVDVRQTTDKYRTVLAVFDSFLYKFTPQHSVNLGLRYEYVKNKYGADIQAQATGIPAVDNYVSQRVGSYESSKENTILLPKAAYLFEVDQQTWGVSYSQGYRTGGLSINRSRAKTDEYNPEQTSNYELSYKFQGGQWNVNSNVFYTNWQDQQVLIQLTPSDPFDTQVTNAARSELYGAELEAHTEITTQHQLTASTGYVRTRFVDFVNGSNDYSGKQFPFAPQWTGKLFYTYSINSSWNASTALRYLGTSYTNAENTRTAPEQFYLDILGQYTMGALNLVTDFYVRNVLDSQYWIYDGRPTSTTSPYQGSYNQVNAPREIGLRVSYFW